MLNLSELGPRSMNDLDFWYSYRFKYSFSLLCLPTLTTIVSEKSIVLTFSHTKCFFFSKLCLLLWAIAIAWFPWQPQYSPFTQLQWVSALSLNCEIVEVWGIQPLNQYFSMFILISHYFPTNKFNIMKGNVCFIRWSLICKGVVIPWNTMVTIISLV